MRGLLCYLTHCDRESQNLQKISINGAKIQNYMAKMAKNDLSEVITEVNDLRSQIFKKISIDPIKTHLVSKDEPSRWSGG